MSISALYDTFVSIVVPVRDRAEQIERELLAMDRVARSLFRNFEVVVVDAGSRDGTTEIVQRMQQQVANLQLYCLNRRGGIETALVAGIDNSIGDYVFTLNLETDPPQVLPMLWEGVQGNEVACGVCSRQGRGLLHAVGQKVFFAMFESSTGLAVPVGISDARIYSRRVVTYISQNNDRHLLLKVLPFFSSYRVSIVKYEPVRNGQGFGRQGLLRSTLAGITILLASSSRPLRLVTLIAFLASSLSLLFAAYVVVVALIKRNVVEGWVSLALPMAIMFFCISTILGILSEYIYMLSQQSGNRPVYSIVRESTSSVLEIQRKLNVVESGGDFADQ